MAGAKDCPRCRLVNPPEARQCDCGYDFVTSRVERASGVAPHRDRVVLTVEPSGVRSAGERGQHIPFGLLRALWIGIPPLIPVAVLVALDPDEAADLLVTVARAAWPFYGPLLLGCIVGYFGVYLQLDRQGLTIRYPLYARRYEWSQVSDFAIVPHTIFGIRVFDNIHFWVDGLREQTLPAIFRPSAARLVDLFAEWAGRTRREQSDLPNQPSLADDRTADR